MAKETYIRLRCTEEFKGKIELLAKLEKANVSNYLEKLLEKEIDIMERNYLKRDLLNDNGEKVGEYLIDVNEKRFIYDISGSVIDYINLPTSEQNKIDSIIDSYEDGFNKVVNGYETYTSHGYTIKRKIIQNNPQA